MSKDKKDPNEGLADDAALATDLGDEDARKAEQLSYYGGDAEDIDDVAADEDRGDVVTGEGEDDAKSSGKGKDDTEGEESDDDKSPGKSQEQEGDEEGSELDGEEDESSDADEESADADEEDSGEKEDAESDETVEDDESEEEEEEEEDDDDDKSDKGIPRHRFNEVNTRMRDAEAEIARRDAEKTATKEAEVEEFDFDAAEDEYMALLLDGKTKDAGQKRKEIRAAEKADFTASTKAETIVEVDTAAVQRQLDSLSREAETMFPIFDTACGLKSSWF